MTPSAEPVLRTRLMYDIMHAIPPLLAGAEPLPGLFPHQPERPGQRALHPRADAWHGGVGRVVGGLLRPVEHREHRLQENIQEVRQEAGVRQGRRGA